MSSQTGLNVKESMEKLITDVIKREAGLRTLDISFEVPEDDIEAEDDADADDDSDDPEVRRHEFLSTKGPGTSFWNSYQRPAWSKEEAAAADGFQVRDNSGIFNLKIVIYGDARIGKSNYLSMASRNIFVPTYKPTIGVEFSVINRTFDGVDYKFSLWDTAGQERYTTITNAYRRGSNALVIGYDITSRESVTIARERFKTIYTEFPWAVIMVIGLKADMEENRVVSTKDGEALARDLHASLFFEGIYRHYI